MALTDFAIIRRSMSARLFSTVTTVLTVAVAVALLLVLLSMRDSGRRAFERGGGNIHLLVSADSDPLTAILNGVFYARPPRAPLSWAQYRAIAEGYPLDFAVPIAQGDSFRGFPVVGTTEEMFARVTPLPDRGWEFASGAPFTGDFEVVLGSSAARGTGLGVGAEVVVTHGTPQSKAAMEAAREHGEFKFKVVGVLRPTGTSHDRAVFTSLQSLWIIHAQDRLEQGGGSGPRLATAADLIESDRKITGIYVRVATRPGQNATALLPAVFDGLRKQGGFTVAQPKQEIDRLFAIVGNIDQVLVAMAGAVMVSSGIAIMLALYNSMEQRRRQIAVLRVLGASQGRVFGLVMTESALLGLIGAAAGVVLASVAILVVAGVMRERLGLVIDGTLPVNTALPVAALTIALAAMAGLVPAVLAYRTSVSHGLRPIG
ncbi:MAG: ABC transporter permease [Phycisphaerae bacterium]|nr:ABC transporter permease [Phycisphaerae bacterium]